MKKIKTNKAKLWTTFFALNALAGIGLIIASCSNPSTATLQSLFNNSRTRNFSSSKSGLPTAVLNSSLLQRNGYSAFIKDRLADVLTNWYKNNKDGTVRNAYRNFETEINKDWDKQVKDYQKQFRNDYLVRLQTNILDPVGGTEETWKTNQLRQRVISDFYNRIFAANSTFLNLTNADGSVVNNPTVDQINDPTKWGSIKFSAGGYNKTEPNDSEIIRQNTNQTFADIQNAIFNYWVQDENPNLISQAVFANEVPENGGLAKIFDEQTIGASNLTASYAFQAFNNDSSVVNAKGNNAYKTIVSGTNGLSKYVDSKNYTIDIPGSLSNNNPGKILLTASEMFAGSNPVEVTAAFVQQYLRVSKTEMNNMDNVGITVALSATSIMDNFLRTSNGDPNTAWFAANSDYVKINPNLSDNFYNNYKKLTESNSMTHIYNVTLPKSNDAMNGMMNMNGNSMNNNTGGKEADQFILFRATDGVHLLAIDGGKYYLDVANSGNNGNNGKGRDVTKQSQFLKFRALLASIPNGISADLKYTFDLKSILSTWFNANQETLLFKILSDAATNTNSFANSASNFLNLPSNSAFKTSITKLHNDAKDYVNAWYSYSNAQKIESAVASEQSKLDAWGKTYIDLVKANTLTKIGIAAPLPYVRQSDGDYFGISEYYRQLTNMSNATKGNSFHLFSDATIKARSELVKQTENLTNRLNVSAARPLPFSQFVFLNSATLSDYALAANLAIHSTIGSTETTNQIKTDYFFGNKDFNDIYETTASTNNGTGSTDGIKGYGNISKDVLQEVIRTYYQQSVFNSLSSKITYGLFKTQEELNKKIDKAWKTKQIANLPYSTDAINYYTFLYTLTYLLRNNLANFKAILQTQIFNGTQAMVSWTVPTNPDSLTNNGGNGMNGQNDPISKFEPNNNFIQGTEKTNWNNVSNGNGMNSSNMANGSSNNNVIPKVNVFNESSHYYNYTKDGNDTNGNNYFYGFEGLSTSSSSGNVNSKIATAAYNNYFASGSQGSLYQYGDLNSLKTYINKISDITELTTVVNQLSNRAGIVVSNFFQKDDKGKDVLNFTQKKAYILRQISNLNDSYFMRFSGYIGRQKAAVNGTNGRHDAFLKSQPLSEDGKRTIIAAYISQINFKDVAALGTQSWNSANGANTGRLGLSLHAFLAVVAQQAMDTSTQAMAMKDLIANSSYQITNTTNAQRGAFILSGDKRLYDALGNTWVTQNASNF